MTRALLHRTVRLLALAFLQVAAAPTWAAPELSTAESIDSPERFAGTWEGGCQDGATSIVIVLRAAGSQLKGRVSIGNMQGDHNGAWVSVLAPPAPEHAHKITEAIVKQNIRSSNGSQRPNGTFAQFELSQTESNKAQHQLLDTPVEGHSRQLVRVQESE